MQVLFFDYFDWQANVPVQFYSHDVNGYNTMTSYLEAERAVRRKNSHSSKQSLPENIPILHSLTQIFSTAGWFGLPGCSGQLG